MPKAEATIANFPSSLDDPDRIWFGSATAAEYHDMDWLTQAVHTDEDVQIRSLTNDWTTFVLAGPKSRQVLAAASRLDWSVEALPWLSVVEASIGDAPVVVMSVSFSGELAYEIHVPNAHLPETYSALRETGAPHGLRLFGGRAIESMRIEKSYLYWKADILTEFDPFECGLYRFVQPDKADYVGKAGLEGRDTSERKSRLVTLKIDCDDRPALPGASIMVASGVVGSITSGEWGHRVGCNLALGFADASVAEIGHNLTVDLLGDIVLAEVIAPSPFDPDNVRPRK